MFENINIYPYHRSKREKKGNRPVLGVKSGKKKASPFRTKIGITLVVEVLAICFVGFFLGRAVLLGELVPFGVAFVVAAVLVYNQTGLFSIPAVILGFATVSKGAPLAGSVLVICCTWIMVRTLPQEIKKPWLVIPAAVFAVTLIVKASLTALTGPSPYDYFSVLFEAVFAAMLTPVLKYGLTALKRNTAGIHPFTGEEIFCILLIFGGVIAGTGDLGFEMVSLKGVLSRLAILLAAFVGGTGPGAAAGAVVGIIPGMVYTVAPAVVGAYSFAGLLAGVCRSFGKAGVATGFILGNIIISVYVTDYGNILSILAETSTAVLVFLLTPACLFNNLKVSLGMEPDQTREMMENEYSFIKEIFDQRVKNWARVLGELSRTFEQVSSSASQNREEESLQKILTQISEKVCSDCTFYKTCWEREFYKTYQAMVDLLALVEVYGKVTPDNLTAEIKKRCSRTKELAITISCLYEAYNLNRYWSRRLLESRDIVSEQLRGISEVVGRLPDELEFELEKGEMGPHLRKKLKEAGTQVQSLTVYPQENGMAEISLTYPPCGEIMECRSTIIPVISKLLEQPYDLATPVCTVKEGEQSCYLRLYPQLHYRLVLGTAGMGKNGSIVSGDSYAFFHLKGGRFGIVLSDGMGTGPRAAMESGTTISLLRYLLESGFGQELAIKTVNSIMALRSPGDNFATVDLLVVNLYSGEADFFKICAEPTFIIREGLVSIIKASSLPVGIIEDIEITSLNRTLEHGDVLVMVSDGLLEVPRGKEDKNKEEWLTDILLDVADMEPQEMADLILKLTQTSAGGPAKVLDDMTVITARLEKRRESPKKKTGL